MINSKRFYAYKYYFYFHKDFEAFVKDLGVHEQLKGLFKRQERNAEINYKIYMISMIVFAGLSILSIPYTRITRFICAIYALLTGCIYYNPFTNYKNKKNKKMNFENLGEFLPPIEFFVFFSLFCGIMTHFFKEEKPILDLMSTPETPSEEKHHKDKDKKDSSKKSSHKKEEDQKEKKHKKEDKSKDEDSEEKHKDEKKHKKKDKKEEDSRSEEKPKEEEKSKKKKKKEKAD